MKKKNGKKWLIGSVVALFLFMNLIAYFHAYQFTHFSEEGIRKTRTPQELSFGQKVNAILFGVRNPKPKGKRVPSQTHTSFKLQSNKEIACWHIQTKSSKGTVIVFHGYGGSKSGMIDKSDEFIRLGYSTLLVDFMGSGDSEGTQTTIGAKEAENVKTAYDYLREQKEENIYLYGTSMGAVAVLKALHDYEIQPLGIIVECPYGSLYTTTCARFQMMGVPSFPMAGLLDFWGGVQNGFWPFSVAPTEYAKSVKCPTLLLYGEKDLHVSREETDEIFDHLAGPKQLKTYPLAGHENYLTEYKKEWVKDVGEFLNEIK